jgi:subfamily B ATP-binding cassette protein HlyB/CyaB
VGGSGWVKRTTTNLTPRLYTPESGRVLVDGVDLAMIDTAWLRKQIGVVLQENFLFNRSVRENIAITDPSVSMERVVAAAKMSGAHEFIGDLAEGYDTMIGEQGSNLSGGQRQRLAIARALITNPRILIFDEATSALDYESERLIQDNMATICKGRTVFMIAHRLMTVRQCHRIVVMEKGRIVEQGNHDQLIEHNGYYAKLHSYQNHTPSLKTVDIQSSQPNAASFTVKKKSDAFSSATSSASSTPTSEVDERSALDLLEDADNHPPTNDEKAPDDNTPDKKGSES